MKAVYLRFHAWRAFRLQVDEPELFHIVVPLGFVSLFICRVCLVEVRRRLRADINERVQADEAATQRGRGWPSANAGIHPHDRDDR